jgi:hypothetical protein
VRYGKCANCGDVLIGPFVQARGSNTRYCKRCFDTKPRCVRCGLPVKRLQETPEGYACAACLSQVHHCDACGAPILGKWYEIRFLAGRFCRVCREQRPQCDFCGRPIVTGGVSYPDGRRSCPICAATAVNSIAEARDLMSATVRYLTTEFRMSSALPFDLALVDNRQMAALNGHAAAKGVKELGLYSTRATPASVRPTIAILSGLPRAAFLETAAHEYAHHWQCERNPELHNLQMIEGFAQWAAAQWLVRNKLYSTRARIENDTRPIYGVGYRKIARYAGENGVAALLRDILLARGDKDLLPVADAYISTRPLLESPIEATTAPSPIPAAEVAAPTRATANPLGLLLGAALGQPAHPVPIFRDIVIFDPRCLSSSPPVSASASPRSP